MKHALMITASYICQPIDTALVIIQSGARLGEACVMGGFAMDARLRSVQSQLSVLMGPMMVLLNALLRMMGLADKSAIDLDALSVLENEIDTIGRNAIYWREACKRFVETGQKRRAKGKKLIVPDWFDWLQFYKFNISPGRLRAIMAALSVKGRACVIGFVTSRIHAADVTLDNFTQTLPSHTQTHQKMSERSLAIGVWHCHAVPD